MQPTPSDRRRYARHRTSLTSLCLKRDEGVQKLEMDILQIRNLGDGGAFLQTEMPYQENTRIDIQFIVPDHTRPITIKGRVAWVRKAPDEPGMGVEFIAINEADRDALAAFLKTI